MPPSAASATSVRRLNPFPFPSETTLRFVLLVIFALCGSASLYGTLWEASNRTIERAAEACAADVVGQALDEATHAAIGSARESVPKIARCAALVRPRVVWQAVGIVLTSFVAGAAYWLLPTLILRRRHLLAVNPGDPPELLEEVQNLCRLVGLRNVPRLVWNPLSMSSPHVFGTGRRNYCAFGGGFVVRLYQDRPTFRAVVLHELAHIRSGDVGKTYAALSVCVAFILAAVVPTASVVVFEAQSWPNKFVSLLRAALWALMIGLSGASVLRAREYYADVQTSVWEGTQSTLVRIFGNVSDRSAEKWWRHLDVHPTASQRWACVVDPSRMFRLSSWDAFAVGVVAWLTIEVLKGVAVPFAPSDVRLLPYFEVATMVILPAAILVLGVGAVGVGVWREAFAALVLGRASGFGAGRLGLALGASCLLPVGLLLSARLGTTEIPIATVWVSASLDIWIGLAVTCGCFFVFQWMPEAVSAWFGVVLRSPSPRRVLRATILAALILIVGLVASASYAVYFYRIVDFSAGGDLMQFTVLTGYVVGIPALVASVVAWAFPLSARLLSRRTAFQQPASWIFLDDKEPALTVVTSWRPTRALMVGLSMGLASCLVFEVVYFARRMPPWLGEPVHAGFSWLTSWLGHKGGVLPALTGFFQVVAATIGALVSRRLPVSSGLLAAFVAGSVAALYLFLPSSSIGQALLVSTTLLAIGSVVALPFAAGVGWIRSALLGRAGAGAFDDPPVLPSPRTRTWSWLGWFLVVSLCVPVAVGFAIRFNDVSVTERKVRGAIALAQNGDGAAQTRLAMMYFSGEGESLPQNIAQAAFWMSKAAENGDSEGMFRLCVMYFRGWGLPQDNRLGAQWLLRSAEQGNHDAISVLGKLYLGDQVELDQRVAFDVLRRAAENGNADAQNSVGLAYRLGHGTSQDDSDAVEWFRRAADQGYTPAAQQLREMCERGVRPACG